MLARLGAMFWLAVTLASLAVAAENPPASAIVLCYHVVESPSDTPFAISRYQFLQQMQYLASTGYKVIPMSQLMDYVAGRRDSLPENAVVITVDDGWRCTYSEIYPVMKQFKFPFTAFIYPKFVNKSAYAVTWKQVREMADNGVDIQSHTYSHQFLSERRHGSLSTNQYLQWLQTELVESKKVIEEETGRKVKYLAYPYGDYDAAVEQAVSDAGYEGAFTCNYGATKRGQDPFKLRRVMVFGNTSFASFRRNLGAKPLVIADATPSAQQTFDGSKPVISARIPKFESLDPASIGMTLLSLGRTASYFDRRDGTVSLVVRDELKQKVQRAVVWAKDKRTGRRYEATWVFTVPIADATAPPAQAQESRKRIPSDAIDRGPVSGKIR